MGIKSRVTLMAAKIVLVFMFALALGGIEARANCDDGWTCTYCENGSNCQCYQNGYVFYWNGAQCICWCDMGNCAFECSY